MFMGQYNQKIDAKGRAIVPAKFRELLGESFVVTMGLDGCVFGFPLSKWEELSSKLSDLSITDLKVRKFIRFFLAGAATLETDKQGRVLIPSALRESASLTGEAVWIGAGSRIEIWNPERWRDNSTFSAEDMDELAEHMSDLGI